MTLDLGTRSGGKAVALTDQERTRHVHVVGATGSGKSKLLEHLMQQDVRGRRGFCLIDPKGSLADDVEAWCASRSYGRNRNIHVVRPGDGGYTAGFNPLRLDRGELPNVRVDATVAACAQVWGGENLNETPRLKKILRAVFFALAVRDLTLAEATYLLRADDPDGTRRTLTAGLPDSVFQFIWDDLNVLSRREFSEYAESTVSRLTSFLASPSVRLMVGQRSSALDFRKVMDEGDIVIVNLGPKSGFSREDARVVGALMINDLFLTALARDEAVAGRHPFTLYVDEAHKFLSDDVEDMLDTTRSLGLHAVLAHQRLGHLTTRGEGIYSAIMGSTRTKIVFGGLQDADAEAMAHEIMRDEIDLQEAKPILDRNVVIGEELGWLRGETWADSEGGSHTATSTDGASETTTMNTSSHEQFYENRDGEDERSGSTVGEGASTALSAQHSYSESDSSLWNRTQGGSQHEAMMSVWGTAQVPYTLEEQFHRATVKLRNLPDRFAIVKRNGKHSVRIRTRDMPKPLCAPAMLKRFRAATYEKSPYIARVSFAEAEMAERAALLDVKPKGSPEETSFWTE